MTKYSKFQITFVLDRSGSMQSVRESTIQGFNEYLKGQKDAPGEAKVTLVQFDNVIETVYSAVDIENVEPLTWQTFQPRGGTALYDAIAYAIDATAQGLAWAGKRVKPLVVILTDGFENQSHKYNREMIFTKISDKRKEGWDFVFIGANQDAFAVGTSLGVAGGYTFTYDASPIGTANAFASVSTSTGLYRGAVSSGATVNNFFNSNTASNTNAVSETYVSDLPEEKPKKK